MPEAERVRVQSSPSLEDAILGPNRDILFENAKRILASGDKKPAKKSKALNLLRAAVITTVLTAGTTEAIAENAGKIETSEVVYNPNKIFIAEKTSPPTLASTPAPAPSPTEAPTPKPTPEPTIAPEILAQKEIGDRNIAEYFLGNLVEQFKQKRMVRFNSDPEYAKRIQKEFLSSNQINMLYLGIDETRERPDEFSGRGIGRADSIMVISFDIKTFKTTVISLPRDLYAIELKQLFGVPKMNAITMVNEVQEGRNVDSNELAKKIIEDATGLPVDLIVKTNIDFMQGAENLPGIFDQLFPDGLEIDVPKEIVDNKYPIGYGTEKIVFHKGKQRMDGKNLTIYGRTRADLDFGRSDRQRQVIQASMMNLLPSIVTELAKGNTKTLDKITSVLEQQKENENLFFDTNIVEIVKTLRNGLVNLKSTRQGLLALGILSANTAGNVKNFITDREGMFTSVGLGYGNAPYSLVGSGDGSSTLIFAGSSPNSTWEVYYAALRKMVYELPR